MKETDKLENTKFVVFFLVGLKEEKGAIETQKQDRWQLVFVSNLSG